MEIIKLNTIPLPEGRHDVMCEKQIVRNKETKEYLYIEMINTDLDFVLVNEDNEVVDVVSYLTLTSMYTIQRGVLVSLNVWFLKVVKELAAIAGIYKENNNGL